MEYTLTNDMLEYRENTSTATDDNSDAADSVYVNAKMLTEDDSTEVIDLTDKYVTPNLIDAHTHPATVAMTKWCTEIDGETKDDILRQIEEALSEIDPATQPYLL